MEYKEALNRYQRLVYEDPAKFNVNDKLLLLETFKNGPPTLDGMREILNLIFNIDKIKALENEIKELERSFDGYISSDDVDELKEEFEDQINELKTENLNFKSKIDTLEEELRISRLGGL